MRTLGVHIDKDIKLLFADPWALVLSLAIPLVLGGLMSLAFGGATDVQPTAAVWLADEDDSFWSDALVQVLDNYQIPIDITVTDWASAQAAMDRGDGSAAIRLPKGFGQAFLKEEPLTLDVITNPAQTILPGIVTGFLDILREGHFYLHRLAGGPIKAIAQGPPSDNKLFANAQIAALSIEINGLMSDLEARLLPPQIELDTQAQPDEPKLDKPLSHFLLPGILVMTLLFLAQGFSDQLWREREVPTLRRVLSAPHGLRDFLISKTVSATAVISSILGACLVLSAVVLDIEWAALLPVWLFASYAGAAFYLLFAFLGSLASSQRGANLITNMLVFPLTMVGGSFFPLEAMPKGIAALGRLTPNGKLVENVSAWVAGEPTQVLGTLLFCTLTGLIGGLGFVRGIRRGVLS